VANINKTRIFFEKDIYDSSEGELGCFSKSAPICNAMTWKAIN
jgi:hypothetical protein